MYSASGRAGGGLELLRIGVVMYQTSLTKGQELVAQRMVREFRRQGHDAFLITSIYHDSEQAVSPDEVKKRGGYVHVFDRDLGIPVIRVNSDDTTWPPRRISFSDFVGVLTNIVDDLKLNVLITHSTLWNGPEEVVKFVVWRRKMAQGGAPRSPLDLLPHEPLPGAERREVRHSGEVVQGGLEQRHPAAGLGRSGPRTCDDAIRGRIS